MRARHLMEPLIRKVGNSDILEQSAIAGALNPEIIPYAERATAAAGYIAKRLDVKPRRSNGFLKRHPLQRVSRPGLGYRGCDATGAR